MATNGYKNRDKDIGWIKETADQYGKYNEKATDGFRDKVPDYTNDFNTSWDVGKKLYDIQKGLEEAEKYRDAEEYTKEGEKAGESASELLDLLPDSWFDSFGFGDSAREAAKKAIKETGKRLGGRHEWIEKFIEEITNGSEKPSDDWVPDNFGSWKNTDRSGNYYIYDPLILDLDGDGIETVGVDFKTASNNAYFDFDNDGRLNATGWVKSDDGLLVRDLNNDGLINNGSEIFGDRTLKQNGELATHGFDALADLDDNKDGIINHQDSAFNTLKVWQDYNKDGISQADELKSLSDLNIQSLTTQYQDTNQNTAGGQLVQLGNFTKTDGSTGQMGDVNFNFSPVFSRHNKIDIDDLDDDTKNQIKSLPNLGGIGRVRSLWEAMSGGTNTTGMLNNQHTGNTNDLKNILQSYENANSKQAQMDLLPSLLKAWAMTDSEYQEYTGTIGRSDQVFSSTGNGGVGLTPTQLARIQGFDEEREKAIARFEEHKHKIGVLDSLLGTKTDKFSAMTTEQINQVTDTIIESYNEIFNRAYIALYPQTDNYQSLLAKVALSFEIDENGKLNTALDFGKFADYIKETNLLNAEQGFVGVMEFLSYFSTKQINTEIQINGLDYLGEIVNEGMAKVPNEMLDVWKAKIHPDFKENTILFISGIHTNQNNQSLLLGDGADNEIRVNIASGAYVLGGNGSDTLHGNGGDDRLNGGNDDDRLFGGNGQDTLIGGTGNDHLDGGADADTYVFSKGHGQDVISEWDGSYGEHRNQDIVKFTDVRSDEIQIQLQGNDLIITGYNGDDKVTIQNFNSYYAHQMEIFEFSDRTLTLDELMSQYTATYLASNNDDHQGIGAWVGKLTTNLAVGNDNFDVSPSQDTAVVDGGDGNDTIQTGSGNDRLNGGNGSDTLHGNGGDDRLNGGNDDDRLFGGNGQDTLIGGTGNDHLDGGADADTYVFSKGHGQDVISEWDGSYGEHRNQDIVKFTDVRSDEIQIQLQGNDLIITGYNGDDKVTIQNFNSYYAHQMEIFEFSDRTLTLDELMSQYTATYLASNNDDHQGIGAWVGKLTTNLAVGNDNFDVSPSQDTAVVDGGDGNDTIQTGSGNDRLNGGNGSDTLHGNGGDDRLNGGNDDDRLFGGNGQDTLIGGTGNDHLDGGADADTYVFSKGHGQDVISEWDGSYGEHRNQDIVKFTDVRSDEIQIQLQGDDLIITGYNGDDKVTIKGFNSYYAYQMEIFEFSDRTLTLDELMSQYTATYLASNNDDHQGIGAWVGKLTTNLAVGNDNFDVSPSQDTAVVDGGDGNDTIQTGSGNDRLNGGNGSDTLHGNGGDDRLNGGNDDDRLFGGNGQDTLIGGTGNDHLDGGADADTYVFSKGHGQDVISEWDGSYGEHRNQDIVKFTDVRSDEIQIQLQGNDLIITGYNGDDKVTIKGFNSYYAHQMEIFEFSDRTLTLDELMSQYTATYLASNNDDHQGIGAWVGKLTTNLAVGNDNFDVSPSQDTAVVDGGDGNDTIQTGSGNDRLNGGNGSDTLHGNGGDDRLNGGNDDDRLFGGNGQDTLIGGTGNDHLDGGADADTYVFSKGHGQDVISEWDGSYGEHRNQDIVKFTDVRSDEIQIQLQGDDLIITGYNGDDKVTIQNFNSYYAHQMEVFEFSDGVVLNLEQLMALKDKNSFAGGTERSIATNSSDLQAGAIMQATHTLIQAISTNITNHDGVGYGNFERLNSLSNDTLWRMVATTN